MECRINAEDPDNFLPCPELFLVIMLRVNAIKGNHKGLPLHKIWLIGVIPRGYHN